MSERYEDELKDVVIDALIERANLANQLLSAQSSLLTSEQKVIRLLEDKSAMQNVIDQWKSIAEEGLGVDLIACRDAAQNGPANDEQV